MILITEDRQAEPLTRFTQKDQPRLVVAVVQTEWLPDKNDHKAQLSEGIEMAARAGAKIVFLPELSLIEYPAFVKAKGTPKENAEHLTEGETFTFISQEAKKHGVFINASLFEKPAFDDLPGDPRGYNTSILVSSDGSLFGHTRKMHIPVTSGYYEDTYFREAPSEGSIDDLYTVYNPETLEHARIGLPTSWDVWFPEVSRLYSLGGANIVAYPMAIGSEPDFPEFDTTEMWQTVIRSHGISNGFFMVIANRFGTENGTKFHGASFISDPYGRILLSAPREEAAVLVAELDLQQREDWLTLFPFLITRRPDSYRRLVSPIEHNHHFGKPIS